MLRYLPVQQHELISHGVTSHLRCYSKHLSIFIGFPGLCVKRHAKIMSYHSKPFLMQPLICYSVIINLFASLGSWIYSWNIRKHFILGAQVCICICRVSTWRLVVFLFSADVIKDLTLELTSQTENWWRHVSQNISLFCSSLTRSSLRVYKKEG